MSNQKTSIKPLKQTSVYQMLKSKGSSSVRAPSIEQVAETAAAVRVLSSKKDVAAKVSSGTLAGMAIIVLALAITSYGSFEQGLRLLAASFCFGLMFVIREFVRWYFEETLEMMQELVPLKELADCERALTLAAGFPPCKAYRKSVLSEGREFLKLDLTLMEKLAQDWNSQASNARAHQLCKKLHGIPA